MNNDHKSPESQQLFLLRLQTFMIFLILLLMIGAVLFLVIKGNQVTALVESIDTVQLNDAVASLKTAADTLGTLDTETLNQGIADISAAAENLGQVDFQKLTDFMDSLETLGAQMELISGFFSGFLKK